MLLIMGLLGWWGSSINASNGRSEGWGFIIGAFLGLIGIITLYAAGKTDDQKIKEFNELKEKLKD